MGLIKHSKIEKIKRQKLLGSEFNRVLERNPITQEPYPARSIYPGGLYELDIKDFVMDYYYPQKQAQPWKMLMYTSHGSAAENIIQQTLFRAGVLKCDHPIFRETKVYCPHLGISGRLDGQILVDKLKYLGAVEKPDTPFTGESELAILEIKETSDYGYSCIKTPSDIPMKFQWAQACYQNLSGIPQTCFLYINRDSMALKPMFYTSPPEMWEKIRKKCSAIWTHVNAKTVPVDGEIVDLDKYLNDTTSAQ